MAEDPVTNLVKQHFQKVREYLQDKKIFDDLTRFSFKFTSDKAIDDTDINTDDDFVCSELDQSGNTAEKRTDLKSLSDTSVREIESEEFLAETDLETNSSGRHSITEGSSSVCNTNFDDNEELQENSELISYQKPTRKIFLDRPETPMLEMYDVEDNPDEHDITPKKMEASQRFILSLEQFQAGDLNTLPKNNYILEEKTVDRSEILEILPRRRKPISTMQLTEEENERTFHKELEMYKKDIKLGKKIHSSSCGTDIQNRTAINIQPQSCSYDQCPKTRQQGKSCHIVGKPKDKHNASKLEVTLGLDVPGKNISDLKNLLEEANTHISRKDPQCEKLEKQFGTFHTTKFPIDGEIHEYLDEAISKNSSLIDEKRYPKMNHLEIQKEMMRRIEEMYKTGDRK